MYIIYVQIHSNQKFLKKKMYPDVAIFKWPTVFTIKIMTEKA